MERLWTPWRLAYVTEASIVTPACIFCDALAHLDTEPLVVDRGETAFVLLNKYPYNNGHLHVVPRWNGDTNFMSVVGETRVLPEELPQTAARLRAAFKAIAQPA